MSSKISYDKIRVWQKINWILPPKGQDENLPSILPISFLEQSELELFITDIHQVFKILEASPAFISLFERLKYVNIGKGQLNAFIPPHGGNATRPDSDPYVLVKLDNNIYYFNEYGTLFKPAAQVILAHELFHAGGGSDPVRDSADGTYTTNDRLNSLDFDYVGDTVRFEHSVSRELGIKDIRPTYGAAISTDDFRISNFSLDSNHSYTFNSKVELVRLGDYRVTDNIDIIEIKGSNYTKSLLAFGLNGNDIITGGSKSDYLYGGDGKDAIFGNEGDDYIDAGESIGDVLDGGDGNDTIVGGISGSEISGGAGNDIIRLRGGDNSVNAGSGDDTIILIDFNPTNEIAGLSGIDTIEFHGELADNVIVTDDGLEAGGGMSLLSRSTGIERLKLSGDVNYVILPDSGFEVVTGWGTDYILGGAGSDIIEITDGIVDGAGGDDRIDVLGSATVFGGAGDDTIYVSSYRYATIAGSQGRDTIYTSEGSELNLRYVSGQEQEIVERTASRPAVIYLKLESDLSAWSITLDMKGGPGTIISSNPDTTTFQATVDLLLSKGNDSFTIRDISILINQNTDRQSVDAELITGVVFGDIEITDTDRIFGMTDEISKYDTAGFYVIG